jgi:hypothetical protein
VHLGMHGLVFDFVFSALLCSGTSAGSEDGALFKPSASETRLQFRASRVQ